MKLLKKNLTLTCMVLQLGMLFGTVPAQAQTFAYVVNRSSNDVSVIATASNTVVATVAVGTSPVGVAITPDGAFAYVTNSGFSSNVSVIATASNTVVATVAAGTTPFGIAITPDGAFAYVANINSREVSVIATASNTVVATVTLGTNPFGVAITPDGAFAYVTNVNSMDVSVIATASNTVVATVAAGINPVGVAITPDGAFAYVANQNSFNVSVIATASNTVVATVALGTTPQGIAITPDGAFVYVTGLNVSVIATASNTVVATVAVGSGPFSIAITPDGAFAYVTNSSSDDVSVIATANNTVVATVAVGSGALGVAITPDPSPVSITLTPVNPPITIPAAGGQFQYALTVTNNTAFPQTFDVWNIITRPSGEEVGPTVGPLNPTMAPGQSVTLTEPQNVPAAPPPGTYTYTFNIGTFPSIIDASASFTFTKLVGPTLGKAASSDVSDWIDGETVGKTALIPDEFALQQNHPNPFNPSTTIAFGVPEASEVKLAIYNLRGQLIQTLHSGIIAAGRHSLVWNGTDFRGTKVASGVYLYRLEAIGFVINKKLVLMK